MPKDNKKATPKLKEPVLSFKLSHLTGLLLRETSVIANDDVPILLTVLLKEKGFPIPKTIALERYKAACERGDADPDEEPELCAKCGDLLWPHDGGPDDDECKDCRAKAKKPK